MDRFINPSIFKSEIFLAHAPAWAFQVNGYPVIMIFWNILLAVFAIWLGFVVARLIRKKRTWPAIGLGIIWLLFMPNAAYIITDGRHIIGYCSIAEYGRVCAQSAWMTFFFFCYAAVGWITFIYSLRPVYTALLKKSRTWGRLFILSVIPLTALGVLLGLVNRWNSWEIVTTPLLLVQNALVYFHNPVYARNLLLTSGLLYILYFTGERLFVKLKWEK